MVKRLLEVKTSLQYPNMMLSTAQWNENEQLGVVLSFLFSATKKFRAEDLTVGAFL